MDKVKDALHIGRKSKQERADALSSDNHTYGDGKSYSSYHPLSRPLHILPFSRQPQLL